MAGPDSIASGTCFSNATLKKFESPRFVLKDGGYGRDNIVAYRRLRRLRNERVTKLKSQIEI